MTRPLTFLAARPSQRLRDLVGARLFELFYFQLLVMEAFHADPNAVPLGVPSPMHTA